MKTIALIIAAVALVALAACSQPISTPNEPTSPTVTYTTYGGFIAPSAAIRTVRIDPSHVTIEQVSTSGIVTSSERHLINSSDYEALRAAIDAANLSALPATIDGTPGIPDLPMANLTITTAAGTTHVHIGRVSQDALPPQLARIVSAIENATAPNDGNGNVSQGGTNHGLMLVPVWYEPKQCETAPWESWYSNGSVKFIKAPTTAELVTAYYSSVGLEVSNVARVNRTEMVCEACGVCDTSYYLTASVPNAQLAKLEARGWTTNDPGRITCTSDADCPTDYACAPSGVCGANLGNDVVNNTPQTV